MNFKCDFRFIVWLIEQKLKAEHNYKKAKQEIKEMEQFILEIKE